MKRIAWLLFIAAAMLGHSFYLLDGFSEAKIQGPLLEGSAAAPTEPALQALGQSYRYLAKGHQCFVFVSEDGRTVLKLFNYSRFTLPRIAAMLPFGQDKMRDLARKRSERFGRQMQSYQIAAKHLSYESGLIYLHLQQGGDLPVVEVQDGAGGRHAIDLNRVGFLLQERAIPIFEVLGKEPSLDKVEAYLDFINKRCDLYIADDDRDVEINFGFVGKRLILLDPGRLFYDPSLATENGRKQEVDAATKRLRAWLNKHYPEAISLVDVYCIQSG